MCIVGSVPERTARSLAVRLNLVANRAMMSAMVAPGGGELGATSAATDLLPSLRPVGSGMKGPFVCGIDHIENNKLINSYLVPAAVVEVRCTAAAAAAAASSQVQHMHVHRSIS